MSDHAWGVVTPVDHKDIYERWFGGNYGIVFYKWVAFHSELGNPEM